MRDGFIGMKVTSTYGSTIYRKVAYGIWGCCFDDKMEYPDYLNDLARLAHNE